MTGLIRRKKISKILAVYLSIQVVLQIIQPSVLWALTGGPSQPEFNSFTPIGTSDMVDLSSGDFNYNIPIMDVGGYPLNLAYNSGVTMDQEASWVGLGWNLNVGQIARQVRGIPDDFSGDEIRYENHMKTNKTYGATFGIGGYVFGNSNLGVNTALGIQYNNYNGISFMPTVGMTFNMHDNVSLGFNITGSDTDGATVSPSLSLHGKRDSKSKNDFNLGASFGVSYNTRQGLSTMSLSTSVTRVNNRGTINQTQDNLGASIGRSFVNNTYTPTKRTGYANHNASIKAAVGGEVFGVEVQGDLQGYASFQKIKQNEENVLEKAFGYEHTDKASSNDILDFNREKDRQINQSTKVLAVANYTYDLYSIQGQGTGGQFRPFRSQVGYLFDKYVNDFGEGGDLGLEFGAGNLVHAGTDYRVNNSSSYTGIWSNQNSALPHFQEQLSNNFPDYQKIFFKKVGELNVDNETNAANGLFKESLSEYQPIRLEISGDGGNYKARNQFETKINNESGTQMVKTLPSINAKIKRDHRVLTESAIQKKTVAEILKYGNTYDKSLLSDFVSSEEGYKNHHIAEINVLQGDGSRYIYGKTAYNSKKVEATFSVSGRAPICNSNAKGLVTYTPGIDNSVRNSRGDEYFNRITTPGYAHTYLLSSILSSDYEDISNDGPTPDDLGAYTKFNYVNKQPNQGTYKWRVPFDKNTASYNEGLKSNATDERGSYVYGEKELLYAYSIETKTHVARFFLSKRDDGYGVSDEDGGIDLNSAMYKIDKISLYSKPEYDQQGDNAEPIKTAHFEYDYELCPNLRNHKDFDVSRSEGPGKLTLKKLYFTYRNSDMGRYTPYKFNYDDFNPSYNLKNYDVWGNYTEGVSSCNLLDPLGTDEFPYTQQDKNIIDRNIKAWSLKSIDLPSGGQMNIKYESDDYKYVQDKETMLMYKVVGAGFDAKPQTEEELTNTFLYYTNNGYGADANASHLYVELDDSITNEDFKSKVIDPVIDQPMYFRFLLNMRKEGALSSDISNQASFDYVTGYAFMDPNGTYNVLTIENKKYGAIPIKMSKIEDNTIINPISKAGFNFGRKYLNNIVYSSVNNRGVNDDDALDVLQKLLGSFDAIFNMFLGPNIELMQEHCSRRFISGKSWIRLSNPFDQKYGGGSRVTSIELADSWDKMTNNSGNPIYSNFYGQEYSYTLDDGSSSGVATYEPLMSKENPFVQPIYEKTERLLAPDEDNYVEEPLGESFFPSPAVTYSRVEVKNLARKILDDDGNVISEVKKHATGKVVHEFFTSYDYPTEVDYTPIASLRRSPFSFTNPLYIDEKKEMAVSQGFVVHTNDMNGKMKSQKVYAEGKDFPISGVDYIYQERLPSEYKNNPIKGKLDNQVTVIDANGNVSTKLIGVEVDVVNDFRENGSSLNSTGINFNVGSFLAAIFPVIVPIPLPNVAKHEDKFKSAVTTKVIHTTGILKEKIAFDLGSKVTTSNLAYDANTGQVLLTETINEYNDNYYNLNYLAYWAYPGMSQASRNLDLEWKYKAQSDYFIFEQNNNLTGQENAASYLLNGDQIITDYIDIDTTGGIPKPTPQFRMFWVTNVGLNGANSFRLIDSEGIIIKPDDMNLDGDETLSLKVIRSGYRNQQSASMASITLMKNPLESLNNGKLPSFNTSNWDEYRIVNSSAVEYSDLWATQCEADLPKFEIPEDIPYGEQDEYTEVVCFNPYLYNVRGDWRAKRSYAYLTNRKTSEDPRLRKDGFYTDFKPLYNVPGNNESWSINDANAERWTFASAVTEYSPFGAELENKDALDRYSSAQYGYNYTLPTAVSSNSRYQSMGFDGFEDYDTSTIDRDHFSFKSKVADQSASISRDHSHTGRSSIAIQPNSRTTLTSRLKDCPVEKIQANNDVAELIAGETISINVTSNDDFGSNGPSDAPISIVSSPSYGTAMVNDNGTPTDPTDDSITYISNSSFDGVDKLEYEICDDSCSVDGKGDCDIAVVTIMVSKPTCPDPNDNCIYPECDCNDLPVLDIDVVASGSDGGYGSNIVVWAWSKLVIDGRNLSEPQELDLVANYDVTFPGPPQDAYRLFFISRRTSEEPDPYTKNYNGQLSFSENFIGEQSFKVVVSPGKYTTITVYYDYGANGEFEWELSNTPVDLDGNSDVIFNYEVVNNGFPRATSIFINPEEPIRVSFDSDNR